MLKKKFEQLIEEQGKALPLLPVEKQYVEKHGLTTEATEKALEQRYQDFFGKELK